MAKVGYARVSTKDQSLENQLDALKQAGCDKIFEEKQSGANDQRPELQRALEYLRPGDTLVVTKIDRLARSTFDLHKIVTELQGRKINVAFLKENIDFGTPAGKLMFTMLGAIAEFERDLINSRMREGREKAKERGVHLGRKGQDPKAIKRALQLYQERENNGMSIAEIVRTTGVPKSSLYAEIKKTTIFS